MKALYSSEAIHMDEAQVYVKQK